MFVLCSVCPKKTPLIGDAQCFSTSIGITPPSNWTRPLHRPFRLGKAENPCWMLDDAPPGLDLQETEPSQIRRRRVWMPRPCRAAHPGCIQSRQERSNEPRAARYQVHDLRGPPCEGAMQDSIHRSSAAHFPWAVIEKPHFLKSQSRDLRETAPLSRHPHLGPP